MNLHGLHGDEECLGEFLIAHAFRRHPSHPALARGQRVHPGQHQFAGSRAHRGKLVLGASPQPGRSRPVGEFEAMAKWGLCLPAPIAAPQGGAEVHERPRMLHLGLGVLEHRDRLAEQRLALGPTPEEPQRPQRDPEGPRRPPPARQLKLLLGELERLLAAAEAVQGQRDLRATGKKSRVVEAELLQHAPERAEAGKGLFEPTCLQVNTSPAVEPRKPEVHGDPLVQADGFEDACGRRNVAAVHQDLGQVADTPQVQGGRHGPVDLRGAQVFLCLAQVAPLRGGAPPVQQQVVSVDEVAPATRRRQRLVDEAGGGLDLLCAHEGKQRVDTQQDVARPTQQPFVEGVDGERNASLTSPARPGFVEREDRAEHGRAGTRAEPLLLDLCDPFRLLKGVDGWLWVVAIVGLAGSRTQRRRSSPAPTAPGRPALADLLRRLGAYANDAVLPFYVLHETVIVVVAYFVLAWPVGAGAQYCVIALISLAATLLLYDLGVRRSPPTRFLFGLKQTHGHHLPLEKRSVRGRST